MLAEEGGEPGVSLRRAQSAPGQVEGDGDEVVEHQGRAALLEAATIACRDTPDGLPLVLARRPDPRRATSPPGGNLTRRRGA
jgi:hypothetical protein